VDRAFPGGDVIDVAAPAGVARQGFSGEVPLDSVRLAAAAGCGMVVFFDRFATRLAVLIAPSDRNVAVVLPVRPDIRWGGCDLRSA
jgi:hypothetical protein